MVRIFIISICLAFCSIESIGQSCKDQLLNCFNQANGISSPTENVTYYLNLDLSYRGWKNEVGFNSLSYKIYITKGIYFFETANMNLYADSTDFFYVDNRNKRILHGKGNLQNYTEGQLKEIFSKLQKELIDEGSISICRDTIINGIKTRFIHLTPNKKMNEQHKITGLSYFLASDKELKGNRVIFFYSEKNPVKSLSISYKEVNFNYKKRKLQKPYDLFFDSKGRLRPDYKDFAYIKKQE